MVGQNRNSNFLDICVFEKRDLRIECSHISHYCHYITHYKLKKTFSFWWSLAVRQQAVMVIGWMMAWKIYLVHNVLVVMYKKLLNHISHRTTRFIDWWFFEWPDKFSLYILGLKKNCWFSRLYDYPPLELLKCGFVWIWEKKALAKWRELFNRWSSKTR